MKREGKSTRVFAVMMALVLGAMALPATASAITSTAVVAFGEGQLEIIEPPEGSGMDFDFDTQVLPVAAVTYPSVSGPHVFIVDDARTAPDGWNVTVSMTSFTLSTGADEFEASIILSNPSNTTTGIDKEQEIIISSEEQTPTLVMAATSVAGRGHFQTQWLGDDVILSIDDTQISNIMPGSFVATLTWLLNVGPP